MLHIDTNKSHNYVGKNKLHESLIIVHTHIINYNAREIHVHVVCLAWRGKKYATILAFRYEKKK